MKLADIAAWPFRALILAYRYGISPFFPGSCRYHPSCSAYAEEAITEHGPVKGGFMALGRIARCHPWGSSGYDPVPTDTSMQHREGSR